MPVKKIIISLIVFCLLLAGCSVSHADSTEDPTPAGGKSSVAAEENVVNTEPAEDARTVTPLPDTTMENLTDAILSVSLGAGNTYVDEDGHTQMELKIYTYDQYDMVDISGLRVGDTVVRHFGEVKVIAKEQDAAGTVYINGGLDNGGFNLVADDSGTFYEIGYNDAKSWYQVGKATLRVSDDFKGTDHADPEQGEVMIHTEDFLTDAVTNYDFTPHNTTIRVEAGQIVEMNRVFTP